LNLPRNGRILVLDDQPSESAPLIHALSKYGSAVYSFSEFKKPELLPSSPFDSIRLVFLDLDLNDEISGPANKAAFAYKIMNSMVKKENQPIIVIAWTTNEDLFVKTKEYINSSYKAFVVQMAKKEFMKGKQYDINKIMEHIEKNLLNVHMMHLFVDWENMMHEAAGITVNDFSNFFAYPAKWDENMGSLFHKLAKARTGSQTPELSPQDVIRNALSMLTSTFIDTVEGKTRAAEFSDAVTNLIKNQSQQIPSDISAKINAKLVFSTHTNQIEFPGNIYEDIAVSGTDKNSLITEMTKEKTDGMTKEQVNVLRAELKNRSRLVFLVVNAMCDYAENKWRTLRLVPGFTCLEKYKKILDRTDSNHLSPLVFYGNELCYIFFDLGSVVSVPLKSIKNKPKVVMRHEFLVDIQSRLSRHINRPGTAYLE